MSTDRLGKLLKAWRLAVESEGADHGEERAKREGEIREHIIGGGEAAPDPWPDTVRKASEAPDLDAAWRLLTDALRLPVVRSSGEWRDHPDPNPVIWRDHAQSPDAVLSSGEVAVLSGAGKSGKSYLALALAVAAAQAEAMDTGASVRLIPYPPQLFRFDSTTRQWVPAQPVNATPVLSRSARTRQPQSRQVVSGSGVQPRNSL